MPAPIKIKVVPIGAYDSDELCPKCWHTGQVTITYALITEADQVPSGIKSYVVCSDCDQQD